MSHTLDLTIHPGLTFGPVEILCKDSAGAAVPLAGWSAFAEVRAKPLGALVLDLGPVIAGDDALGKVSLPAQAPAVTSPLVPGDFLWDLILQDPDGNRLPPLVAGRVRITRTVSDAVNFPALP